ncbi:ATP-binding protein [Saccharomonospora azurea]|uniref:AlbA family DNA-binding domain-containing protein n=1 Tax=Saccharomonospora azurea TaxID=40988 RepID=UPI00332FB05B
MLNFDTTKRPFRHREWQAVLDAVYRAEDSDEQTWIEWKSTLDLKSRKDIAENVAKHILAFANRDPESSKKQVEGAGILLIGLEPGSVKGVDPVDNADLDQIISHFVGDDGPEWQPHWLTYQEKTVLAIEVAAPQWGDPIHCFKREIDRIRNGAIYVRRLARSEPATSEDVRRLSLRLTRKVNDKLGVDVVVDVPGSLSKISMNDHLLKVFIEHEKRRLLSQESDSNSAGTLSNFSIPLSLDRRTPAQYFQEVERYLEEIMECSEEIMLKAALHVVRPPTFRAINQTNKNYSRLKVRLELDPPAWAGRAQDEITYPEFRSYLPEPPKKRGDGGYISGIDLSYRRVPFDALGRGIRSSVSYSPEGEMVVTFTEVDLRPHDSEILEDGLSLLIPAGPGSSITGRWKATATNVDDQASGEIEFDFNGPDIDLSAALARELSREAGD